MVRTVLLSSLLQCNERDEVKREKRREDKNRTIVSLFPTSFSTHSLHLN